MSEARSEREAERGVVGAVLLGGVDALDAAREQGLRPHHFYEPALEALWGACERLAAQGRGIDPASVRSTLTPDEKRSIGHPGLLPDLVTEASFAPAVPGHARVIVDAWTLRSLSTASVKIRQLAETAPLDRARDALEHARAELDAVEAPEENETLSSAAQIIPGVIEQMESGRSYGVSTGLSDLDRILGGGLYAGSTTVIGARPSVGKTMLGVNLAAAACRAGVPTLLFSHEMTRTELMQRFIARESGVTLSRIRAGALNEGHWTAVAAATARISEWPFLIDDASSMTIPDYRARIRKLSRTQRPGLVIADYLQLIKPVDGRVSREQQVSGISAMSKALARDFGIPMVLLAQLSRATEQRKDAKPVLSDLRESGAIENDADVVILMHQQGDDPMELNVAKNRQGERDSCQVVWVSKLMRASNLQTH